MSIMAPLGRSCWGRQAVRQRPPCLQAGQPQLGPRQALQLLPGATVNPAWMLSMKPQELSSPALPP